MAIVKTCARWRRLTRGAVRWGLLASAVQLPACRSDQPRGEAGDPGGGTQVADRLHTPPSNPHSTTNGRAAPASPPEIPEWSPTAVHADVLLVNADALTMAEVLYELRDPVAEARRQLEGRALLIKVAELVQEQTRQDVGAILVYQKATRNLTDQQREALAKAVEAQIDDRATREFGGSAARFHAHLEASGLTPAIYRTRLERQLIVRSYLREMLMPKVRVRRDELMQYYQENAQRFSTRETRELLMIAAPFEAFLPEGRTWEGATEAARARARLTALRTARGAHEALRRGRPFKEVAREFSRGPRAAEGGSWGHVTDPLRPPLDKLTSRIFGYRTGQYSEPTELDTGWYVVGCGAIVAPVRTPFSDVQRELRRELEEQRFNQLATQEVAQLAQRAAISNLGAFIETAARMAAAGWMP